MVASAMDRVCSTNSFRIGAGGQWPKAHFPVLGTSKSPKTRSFQYIRHNLMPGVPDFTTGKVGHEFLQSEVSTGPNCARLRKAGSRAA